MLSDVDANTQHLLDKGIQVGYEGYTLDDVTSTIINRNMLEIKNKEITVEIAKLSPYLDPKSNFD